MNYRQNIFVDRYLDFINEAYTYFFRKFKKPIKFITVGNDVNNKFVIDDQILQAYLVKNDLEFVWRDGNLMLSSKYVPTIIKNNIDYTSIKSNIILTVVS